MLQGGERENQNEIHIKKERDHVKSTYKEIHLSG